MVIKKQHVISWLLDDNYIPTMDKITISQTDNQNHLGYLMNGLKWLSEVRDSKPEWGVPEMLMPSFEKVMKKSAKSFYNIDHQLFQEFYNDNICGILLHKDYGTIVYGFGENTLYVWLFKTVNGYSVLYNYFYFESTEANTRKVFCWPSLFDDPQLYDTTNDERYELYSSVANLLISYLAVKKYAEVETIVVPANTIKIVEDTIQGYKHKDKVKNDSGQEVIIMDSRWFVKIINDNDIFVRGFFRLQNKKDADGNWYKELIFIDSFVRHGYHRNAKIEDDTTENKL